MSEEKKVMKAECEIPPRFTVPQRIEHFFLVLSFTVLGVTGLVQMYATHRLSEWLIGFMGGIAVVRVIHRAAAILFALSTVYHVIILAHKFLVRRLPMTMLPTLKDVTDGIHSLGYSLFLRREPPQMPRYNFAEKLEYWALIWGGLIMIVTGFMLWNPLITTKYLPGQFIPAAKAAHGGEALLAVLAIIVWHFYNVHIKMFNKSMLTGKMTAHQMEEEHGEEWTRIVAGGQGGGPFHAANRWGRVVFVPFAILFATLGVGGIYWAATAESTAISTLPAPTSPIKVYSPAFSSPEEPAQSATVAAPAIPHPVAGQEQCYACHGRAGIKPAPSNHEGRPLESCRLCHLPGPPAKAVKPTVEEKTAGQAEEKAEEKVSGPRAVPHATDTAAYKNCGNCHGIGKMKAFPENHSAYPTESCTACHK